MEFLEVNSHTMAMRLHDEASLRKRVAALKVADETPKLNGLINAGRPFDGPHSFFRLFYGTTYGQRRIQQAMPSGAWGFDI